MKMFAKYNCSCATHYLTKRLGHEWYEVKKEFNERYPNGVRTMVVINGVTADVRDCQVVYVF